MLKQTADITDHLPVICGHEEKIKKFINLKQDIYLPISNIKLNNIQSAFGIALHMHQPTILSQTHNLHAGSLISNLQYMLENPNIGDNHNAPIFLQCYSRMPDFIRELTSQGCHPRIMLDYSGNLLWGLQQIETGKVLDNLKLITNRKYCLQAEWLGTMWSHAVVSSTPVPDVKLHITAWQEHFASIFGFEALKRIQGFSPPEMHLPIHPDVCYEYISALKECGYQWLLVQEHTIENLDGTHIRNPYLPHKLSAKNSLGHTAQITVLIKTQGSDTKLVGQMQPYYEAKTKHKENYGHKHIPPFVLQISDGENGGVMMNEFPAAYKKAFGEVETSGTAAMNGSEYLEFIKSTGLAEKDFTPVQPVIQHKIWEFVHDYHPQASDEAIAKAKEKYSGFNLDKASWTNDKSWVKGYSDVLDPINKLSVEFHKCFGKNTIDKSSPVYREALLYLLLSQTSCFRYWGAGLWTEYAKEICRRGMQALKKV